MHGLSRILFQMCSGDADGFFGVTDSHGHLPFADNRQRHLRNLVALGQIGIEVIFARKHGCLANIGVSGKRKTHSHLHHISVNNW